MENRVAKRFKRRMACELLYEGHSQRSIVLDVSRTGLFVQTSARLNPGAAVELLLQLEGGREPIRIKTRVARQKAVPSTLTSVAQGGIGLRILEAPAAYYEVVNEKPPAQAPPLPPPPAAAPPKPRFRVRVKQTDGPRSRVLEIDAESPERARAKALAEVGNGWEALAADRV